ncbi:copper amine oxidase-like protein [Cytobacillus oceanisediminis]|uniref:Copper amine oxidase-like protein n=1 Tax=Cytobacillus oceanisediminis TaxID=665099 RepID=A0A2V2ZTW7_9BACI|nr:stalk domain-containing protein [Cytobacillus oceanisediminis]PWW27497.1 copper amine oxidase-like protein [Cytobacillus oceanisediminis]
MWRASLFIFLILSGTITGMLVWQWKAYSEQTGRAEEHTLRATQQINVESLQNELKITQTVTGLIPEKEYRLIIPDSLFQWKCKNGQEKACDSADENPYTFFSNEKMIFEYVLPINKDKNAFMLNDWTVSISGVEIESSLITISDSFRRKGSWAAGVPLKAQKKMKHIDYYIFEGRENTPSLYWQQGDLVKKRTNTVDIYSENQSLNLNFEKLNNLGEIPYLSVVLTDHYQESYGRGILIAGTNTKKEKLEKMLIIQAFEKKFGYLPLKEDWLIDALASHAVEQKAGTEKGNRIFKELEKELAEDELKVFFQDINMEESLNTEKLDKQLSDLKGHSTRFFTVNKDLDAPFVPLYFDDGKKVFISGKEQKGFKLIHKNGKKLLPFKAAMEALGFDVRILSGEETMLLAKGNNSYRFYLNRNVFIYNEEDYGLLENPLTVLNGTAFIEIQWLQSLFDVSIEEWDHKIKLTAAPK